MLFRRNERCPKPYTHPLAVNKVMMLLLTVKFPRNLTPSSAKVFRPASESMLR